MSFDTQWTLIGIAAGIAVVILLWLLLRARLGRQRLSRDEAPAEIERSADPYAVSKERPYMKAAAPPAPPAPAEGIAADPAAADEPVVVAPAAAPMIGDIAGIAMPPGTVDHADDLTRLKGVGPKLAALLNEQGITQLSQLAALGDEEVAALDGKLGNFKGRLARDRVTEQARLLAGGDRVGYEAAFGKLG